MIPWLFPLMHTGSTLADQSDNTFICSIPSLGCDRSNSWLPFPIASPTHPPLLVSPVKGLLLDYWRFICYLSCLSNYSLQRKCHVYEIFVFGGKLSLWQLLVQRMKNNFDKSTWFQFRYLLSQQTNAFLQYLIIVLCYMVLIFGNATPTFHSIVVYWVCVLSPIEYSNGFVVCVFFLWLCYHFLIQNHHSNATKHG